MTGFDLSAVVDLVVFDFDGTLCESADVKTDAFHRMYLEEAGEEIAARVRAHHLAHAGASRYEKIRHYEEVLLGRPCNDVRLEELASRFARLVFEAVVAAPMVPGADDFLAAYAHVVPIGVASATPVDELRAIITAKGLQQFFAAIDGYPTTKGDAVLQFLDRFGAAASRTVMVGDQPSDRAAAIAAGTQFVGVRPPGGDRLFPAEETVIPDLTHLEDVLRGQPSAASR